MRAARRASSDLVGVWSAFYTLRRGGEENNGVIRIDPGRDEVEEPAIEGRQPALVANRHCEDMGVGHLARANDPLPEDEVGGGEVGIVCKETMPGQSGDFREDLEGSAWGYRPWNDSRVRRDANESGLGDRARGPTRSSRLPEPRGSRFMVDVIRPRERHEDIDVEESPFQASSSASRTIPEVITGASGGTSKTGKPPLF